MPGTPSHKILYTRTKPTYCRVSNEAKRNDEDYDEDEVNKIYGEYGTGCGYSPQHSYECGGLRMKT